MDDTFWDDTIQINVVSLSGELIVSLSLELTSTVQHLRKTVADKIGIASNQVLLQYGDSLISNGHGRSLIQVFAVAENYIVTAIQLAPRELVAEFFVAHTGYDEGFVQEVKVSAGTRADFDRLLDEARMGVQSALGLDHYFVPILLATGHCVLEPTETAGKYIIASKRVHYRLKASFDDENDVVIGAVEQGFPCEGEILSGVVVANNWLQVSVHATKIKCERCNGSGGCHGPAGQTCRECCGTGFKKNEKDMQVVTVGAVEEKEVTAQDLLNKISSFFSLALRKGPIPGRPQMSTRNVLELLRDANSTALQFTYEDQRTRPVLREGFGIGTGQYTTVFAGDHIFEMFYLGEY